MSLPDGSWRHFQADLNDPLRGTRATLALLALACLGGAVLLALSLFTGCGSIAFDPWIPRDGSPVLLELGPGVSIEAAEQAAAVWAPAGVNFVTSGEHALHTVRVELSADLPANLSGRFMPRAPFVVEVRTNDPIVLAHELGHALGLKHVEGCAVMSAPACSPTLTAADFDEFARTQF